MADEKTVLTPDEVAAAGLEDWSASGGPLAARFRTGDFATGLRLVNAIGELAEAANHHPDVELTYPQVRVTLVSHDVGGLTSRDLELAGQISAAAAGLGVSADE